MIFMDHDELLKDTPTHLGWKIPHNSIYSTKFTEL